MELVSVVGLRLNYVYHLFVFTRVSLKLIKNTLAVQRTMCGCISLVNASIDIVYTVLLSYVNSMTSPLFHPNFEGIPFGPDRPRWGQCEQVPRLFGREIILYIFQPM